MPVIRVGVSTPTPLPPGLRESLLGKLKGEIEGRSIQGGPVIFEIPEGTETIEVLVVWEDGHWAELPSEDRTALILDAYGDKRQRIVQALGVTYEEAVKEQLLPCAVVSQFEHDKMRLLVCGRDQNRANAMLTEIRKVKRDQGGIVLPNGNVELRFPTRAMADQAEETLVTKHRDLNWRVIPECRDISP